MLRAALVILIISLVFKDVSQLGDPYILRGIAQLNCLLIGCIYLIAHTNPQIIFRYWPIFGYLFSLLLSCLFASDILFVFLQIASITSVMLFSIAYYESNISLGTTRNRTLIHLTIFAYFIVLLVSIMAIFIWPNIAYEHLLVGNMAGYQTRFRGLFSKSGMMGACAGLLIGLAWFGITTWWRKIILIIPALVCLLMTQSRTFWVASIIASTVTIWFYYSLRNKLVLICIMLITGIIGWGIIGNIDFNSKHIRHTVRSESLTGLTGRVNLWQQSWQRFTHRPFLGYGLTLGSEAIIEKQSNPYVFNSDKSNKRETSKTTLHNGYVQSIFDSGLVGTIFYAFIILLSFCSFVHKDTNREFPAEFYALVFLIVANCGESIIYGASSYHTMLFWILAVFALSLRKTKLQ